MMNEIKPMFIEKIKYSIYDKDKQPLEEGQALIAVEEENLSLMPDTTDAVQIELRDIAEINEKDHSITVGLHSGHQINLSHLGYRYADVYRELIRSRNEVILKDLLMGEAMQAGGIKAEVDYVNAEGPPSIQSPCEVRLYNSALVFLPHSAEVTRIPYSFIQSVKDENYTMEIQTEMGERITFSHVGSQYDYLKTSLSAAMNRIVQETQDTLRELIPHLPSMEIRNASRLLKDGRAAEKSNLEKMSPGLWVELEKNITTFGMGDYYTYLLSLSSNPDHVYAGLKKGLMGSLTGTYLWFMVPIYHTESNKPGNAIVLEASTNDGASRATYFFRVLPRKEYGSNLKTGDIYKTFCDFSEIINRSLITINFRREPIYLSNDQLQDLRFKQYQFSINRIPELRQLRHHFIGRVMHHSLDQWKQDTFSLLKFNVESQNDHQNWKKGDEDTDFEDIQ